MEEKDYNSEVEEVVIKAIKNRNHLVFILAYVAAILVYTVIIFSFKGTNIQQIVYSGTSYNKKPQPTNRILGVKEPPEEEPIEEPGKESDGETTVEYDNTRIIFDNYIYLTNQFPMMDESGKSLEGELKMQDIKVEFSRKDVGRKIEIILRKLSDSDLNSDWVKVYLTKNGNDLANCYRESGRIKTFNDYSKFNNDDNTILIYGGTISSQDYANQYADYRLRLWISEDVVVENENFDSKTFVAKLTVTIHD